MLQTRRDFLRRIGVGVGSAAALSTADMLSEMSAYAGGGPTGYRALICVFMGGGNDSNNMVISENALNTGGYAGYLAQRTVASGINIPQGNLLHINFAPGTGFGTTSPYFGFHPNFNQFTLNGVTIPGLYQHFTAVDPANRRCAVVCNVGPLVHPMINLANLAQTPRQVYQNRASLGLSAPAQLFSHSDQVNEWQTCRSLAPLIANGWGGRIVDGNMPPNTSPSGFPMLCSIAGTPTFGVGISSRPLVLQPAPTALNNVLVLQGFGGTAAETARRQAFNFLRTVDRGHSHIHALQDLTQLGIDVNMALSANPTVNNATTPFPNTGLGNQLQQVAKLIVVNKSQPLLGLNRQIFFCSFGGFDTHSGQAAGQGGLLTQLNQAMSAFYYWCQNNTNGIGDIRTEVCLFTMSDFARTFNPNANIGTDHGWGSHQIALGGQVVGGQIYGIPVPTSRGGTGNVFNNQTLQGAYDTQTRGLWVPNVGADQYANTLARWYGLPQDATTLNNVFPHLALKTNPLTFNQPSALSFLPAT